MLMAECTFLTHTKAGMMCKYLSGYNDEFIHNRNVF